MTSAGVLPDDHGGDYAAPSARDALPAAPQGSSRVNALETLQRVLDRLDVYSEPCDEESFRSRLSALRSEVEEAADGVPLEVHAEVLAFSFHAHDHQESSIWGLYFGPLMSGLDADGSPWAAPALSSVTEDVLAYWVRRAGAAHHPVMRARYADLLWEIPKKSGIGRPAPEMARIAIESYLEAIHGDVYDHSITAIAKAKRALDIALSLGDTGLIELSRDAMLAVERRDAVKTSGGVWGICFDTFIEPPHKIVTVADDTRDQLVADLESRLDRFVARDAGKYHPADAESAAMRLARFYRRAGRSGEVARVLGTYEAIVRAMQGVAAPLVVSHSLERLYDAFKGFGLHSQADALGEAIRRAGEETLAEMKPISVEMEIPREKVEAYFAEMLGGSSDEVLGRIAVHFVPARGALEQELRELAATSPLQYLIPHTIKDDGGRTVAIVGSIDSDLEGQLVRHIAQNIHISSVWLRESMRRGLEAGQLSEETLIGHLFASPLFRPDRRPMLEAGIRAYIAGDYLTSIHILVPQAEQAVRQLATLVGAPIYTQRRGGGLHARTLDDLLRDSAVSAILDDDLVTYLRVLLTDARGWNVRNTVCHGLAPVGAFTWPVADRVIHALLVLGLLRTKEPSEATTGGEGAD